jgi:hypothetical protein
MTLWPWYAGMALSLTTGVLNAATRGTRQIPVCMHTSPVRNLVPNATRTTPPDAAAPAPRTPECERSLPPNHLQGPPPTVSAAVSHVTNTAAAGEGLRLRCGRGQAVCLTHVGCTRTGYAWECCQGHNRTDVPPSSIRSSVLCDEGSGCRERHSFKSLIKEILKSATRRPTTCSSRFGEGW